MTYIIMMNPILILKFNPSCWKFSYRVFNISLAAALICKSPPSREASADEITAYDFST